MIYIYIFVPLIFIGLFVWNTLRGNKHLKRVKEYSKEPNVVKIALWATLETIDEQKVDFTYSYWKKIRNETDTESLDIAVLLLKAGQYNFVINNKSNPSCKIKVDLKAGFTYQLGFKDNEAYCIEDPQPNRYNL